MKLISQDQLLASLAQRPSWHRQVVDDLGRRLGDDPSFPCTFSKNAFTRKLVKFVFVEDTSTASLRHFADVLAEYVDISRLWDGNLSTAHPLVVAFSQTAIYSPKITEYHAFGWRILQELHYRDSHPWPENVARDPHAPYWSMCFHGMQIFVNMSCPAHVARRSRNLGAHFLFIINPRERFDIVAGNTPTGRKVRENIRSRITNYDSQAHCPQLGSYIAGETEWWQYGITDSNRERTDRCPFTFKQMGSSSK